MNQHAAGFQKPTYFLHVSPGTGHTRRQLPDEVSTETIEYLAPLLANTMATGAAVPVPVLGNDIHVRASRYDGGIFVELLYRSDYHYKGLVVFGISLDGNSGAALWQGLHGFANPAPTIPPVPSEPWIAAVTLPTLVFYPDVALRAEDFERCVAWALASHPIFTYPKETESSHSDGADISESNEAETALDAMPASDGAFFDFHRKIGPTLTLYLSAPNDEEMNDILRGRARFALAKQGSVLFLLAKFGNLEWLDAPFNNTLYPPELHGLPDELPEGSRYALAVRVIDRLTSQEVRGARLVTFAADFSRTFANLVKRQAISPICRETYDVDIARAYAAYPTSRRMARDALATCWGGA